MIRFRFKPEKFINAVAYLSSKSPQSTTKMIICKLVFFADKEHLLQYGRTITGDTYYKLPHGPTPTQGLDILRGKSNARNRTLADAFIAVVGDKIRAKRNPDLTVFSKSDVRVLAKIVEKYGSYTASHLRRLSHKEPSWLKAKANGPMSFELFFEGHPESEKIKTLLISDEQEDARNILALYRAAI